MNLEKNVIMFVILFLLISVCFLSIPQWHPESTLADAIESTLVNSAISSENDPLSINAKIVFGLASDSAFDTATIPSSEPWQIVLAQQEAALDGYRSATLNQDVAKIMATQAMSGSVPITSTSPNYWSVYDRYLCSLYTETGSTWNLSNALAEVKSNVAVGGGDVPAGGPNLGFSSSGGCKCEERYYDEWGQNINIFMQLGDPADAAVFWAGVNMANWNGNAYWYRPDTLYYESEAGFFAALITNYALTDGGSSGIPYFPQRIVSDIYTKFLELGWNSPLWYCPAVAVHAQTALQMRPAMTNGAIEAIDMLYPVANGTFQTAWQTLLTGSNSTPPAWQELMNSRYDSASVDTSSLWIEKALSLFLYGIIPETGSLAIPPNDLSYEDWSSMCPAAVFRFNCSTHTITVPVNQGAIGFLFGSAEATYDFPSSGVYNVTFSSDWNTVSSAAYVESIPYAHLNG